MTILKSIILAFSLYSKIPVPQLQWEEKDMKYMLCFFPWVGIAIGLVFYGWSFFCFHYGIGSLCYAMLGASIPLILSGGFHLDGFMDTMDALHSYKDREEKLAILKDSHIGAFSVIMVGINYLLYVGTLSEVHSPSTAFLIAMGFFLSRTLSGIGVVSLKAAKETGLLYTCAQGAEKTAVRIVLFVQLLLAFAVLLLSGLKAALPVIVAACGTFVYYRWKSYREFGGITGDTAGYFVTICETAVAIAAVIGGIL